MRFFATARRIAAGILALAAASASAANYSDIWWNPRESGWGLTIADHETDLWLVWYTYRKDGSPTWMFASGGTFDAARTHFAGTLYQTTGPAWRADFSSKPVSATAVGTVTVDFAPSGAAAGTAQFHYTVGDVSATKTIERFSFGSAGPAWGSDATDLWWDPGESGWGVALTQHGSTLFGVWYTYDDSGQPLFVVLPSGSAASGGQFLGDLYTTRGPWFGEAAFDTAKVTTVPFAAGQVTLQAMASVQGFTPKRGGWTTRLGDGTTIDKFITQLGFGNAAPGVAEPSCLSSGTCVARQIPSASTTCSYRTCVAAVMGDPDYYGYSMTTPCSCSTDATLASTTCLPSRPQVIDGAACSNGQGCAVGSVCADLRNGMPSICMPQASFSANYCTAPGY